MLDKSYSKLKAQSYTKTTHYLKKINLLVRSLYFS